MTSTVRNFTLGGIVLGILFPVLAWVIDARLRGTGLGIADIAALHRANPIHYIIDVAPLLLGVVFHVMGRIQATSVRIAERDTTRRSTRDQLARYIEPSGGRVWETDEEHRFTYVSGGGDEMLESSARNAIGHRRWEAGGLSASAEAWASYRELVEARQPISDFRCTLTLPDGKVRHLSISGQPIIGRDGKFHGYRGTTADITRQVQAETSIEESERKYRRLFEYATDSIFVVDPDTYLLVDVNYAAAARLGYTVDEMIGMTVSDINPEYTDMELTRQRYAETRDKGGITFEATHVRKDGTHIPMEISSHYIDVGGRQLVESVGRDITERKRVEEMKDEFVSTVSHELRTPLTSIIGSLSLLASGRLGETSDQARHMITLAHKNSERLLHLVNDILDIERIESGGMELELETVDLNALVEQAIAENTAFAAQFGVVFMDGAPVPGAAVSGDWHRLLQVMANLLSNAAKFSPAGGRVDIRLIPNGEMVRIAVSDHGPGIKPSFRDRIFDKFMQSDMSDSKEKGGTGLGLSISKAIVEMHGGEIGFENNPDGGATFFFDLPRERDSRARLA